MKFRNPVVSKKTCNNMGVAFQLLALVHILLFCEALPFRKMEFAMQHTWHSNPVDHEPTRIAFSVGKPGVKIEVSGPFFNDLRKPPGYLGIAYLGLRNFEIVKTFFLNSTRQNYLEVLLCPYGQHLAALYSEVGHVFYGRDTWQGQALIPWTYFPPNVNKMNSYAVYGSGEKRTHEALYPIPKEHIVEGQKPNVLEYFQNFRLHSIVGEDWVQPESDLWKGKA